jgi:hypothetical protein
LTAAEAQAALAAIALDLLGVEDRCREILASLPRSPEEDAMIEGRIAWDLPTELLTTIECVLEDQLRLAVEALERAARVSEEELRTEFRPERY